MLKKISFALLIGILLTLFSIQHDAWTHKKLVLLLHNISRDYLGGNFSCNVHSLHFFSPSLVLHDLEMKSVDNDSWSWRCKKLEVSCSWLQLLFKGMMDQYVVIDGFECTSATHNSRLAIEPHIMAMMQKSFLPFSTQVKSLVFRNAHFYSNDDATNSNLEFSFNSSSLRIGAQVKTTMSIEDGTITYKADNYIEKIALDVSLFTQYTDDVLDFGVQVAGTFILPHMDQQGGCYITGGWKSNHGRFSIRNMHNTFMIDPIIVTEREIRLNGRFPLSYAAQCLYNNLPNQTINGTALFALKISRDELRKINGQLVIEDATLNQTHICNRGKILFDRHGHDWRVRLDCAQSNQECKGTGYWHESTGIGEFFATNTTALSTTYAPYWRILQHNFSTHIAFTADSCNGTYNATATNILNDAQHSVQGNFLYNKKILALHGSINENEFSLDTTIFPNIEIKNCTYKDKDKKTLIALAQSPDNPAQIQGLLSFSLVRTLIQNILQYDLQGEGALGLSATITPAQVSADITLDEATIRLPQTYNFIDGFNAHVTYDFTKKTYVLENINLSLHTGAIHCSRATAHYDNGLLFAHAPLLLDRCLLNIKKDLFAIVSGDLLFSKTAPSPARVSGHIMIDKAHLKENLFSGIIQKQLLSYTHSAFSLPNIAVECDLTIETKSPIKVDTTFLETNAKVNLHVKKDMHDPAVTGSITLHSGTLNFPYKPLYISKGTITFSPEQLFDPTVELVARNKIKKYDVALQIEGTVLHHHISLDSTPPLSEEQIVGLLLIGSEENSLNSMMPALIVQNLKNLIFSNNQSTFFDKYFKPLLRTFNINLVPSFSDQTGRGGLRGALEITIDDRWRAVIQKNFSLTEDTKFELEFLVSDDITLRAIRDERRDIGGEVEMRWKF